MENRKVIILNEPLEVGGNLLNEIEMKRPTIGDEEDAMQIAIELKKGNNPLSVEMCLIGRLTKLPYDKIRMLHSKDYAQFRAALHELNGIKVPADTENPMISSGN